MPIDLESYRQRLRAAVQPGTPAVRMDSPMMSTRPPSVGHQPGGDFPYVEDSEIEQVPPERRPGAQAGNPTFPMARATMDAGAPAQAPAPAAPAAAAAPAGKKIPVGPPGFKPKFDNKALETAKTPADVMGAMKPASKQVYLDWWEGQYGAIDQKWNAVMKEVGQRPDARRKPSREEMFDMLLEFGLHMLKNSQTNDLGGALAQSVGGAVEGHYGRRFKEQGRHDALKQQAREGRAADMKEIGTYGDALKGQAELDMRGAEQTMRDEQRLEAETRRKKMEGEAPETIYTDQGVQTWDAEGKSYKPATGMDGKPLTTLKTGGRGRSGAGGGDSRVAEQKRYDHLVSLGVEDNLAMRLAYKVKSGDPKKDHKDVFRDTLRSTFGDEAKAREVADSYVGMLYGEGAIEASDKPILPNKNDPLTIRD